jgi:hypothetical protein
MTPPFALFFCLCVGMIIMVYIQDLLENYEHPVVHPE